MYTEDTNKSYKEELLPSSSVALVKGHSLQSWIHLRVAPFLIYLDKKKKNKEKHIEISVTLLSESFRHVCHELCWCLPLYVPHPV